eukprot:tig00020675_g12697.t1
MRFLPRAVLSQRRAREGFGVVVLFDVAGFSTLCERMGGSDEEIEGLSAVINDVFGVEIGLVEEFDGDVISFLGDGLLAAWMVAGGEGESERSAAAASKAVQCALRVQNIFESRPRSSGRVEMRLRAAVAAGTVREYRCGSDGSEFRDIRVTSPQHSSVPGRYVYFIRSPAIGEAGAALSQLHRGETALCASVLPHLPPSCVSVSRRLSHIDSTSFSDTNTSTSLSTVRLPTLQPPSPARAAPPSPSLPPIRSARSSPAPGPVVARPETADLLDSHSVGVFIPRQQPSPSRGASSDSPLPWTELELFVPCTVRDRWEEDPMAGGSPLTTRANVDLSRFNSEFRSAAVLFAELRGLSHDPPAVQAAVLAMQRALYTWSGSLRQITFDDKGLVFIGVWGLWPLSHEDDPARAVLCAVELKRALAGLGVSVSIGAAAGLVFCTYVGNASRCEFSVFGSVVNKAARLMAKAASVEGQILADTRCAELAGLRVPMELAGNYTLKGFKDSIPAFRLQAASSGPPLGRAVSERKGSLSRLSSAGDGTDGEGPPSPISPLSLSNINGRGSPMALATGGRGSPPPLLRRPSSAGVGAGARGAGARPARLAGRALEAEAVGALVASLSDPTAKPPDLKPTRPRSPVRPEIAPP